MGNEDTAKDLVQDTLLKAFLQFERLEQSGNVRAWSVTVLTNMYFDEVKHRKVVKKAVVQLVTLEDTERRIDIPMIDISDAAIQDAVDALEPELRVVVECCYMQGLLYKEAADRLEIPIGTVGSRLKRAREQLKELLVEREPSSS
jgi:RNA polymerase sigma-70 factor (ECF subfamily)